MKISVSYNEVKEVLAQADEIYVPYEERSRIADLAHNYDVDILLGSPKDIDISELKQLKTLAKDRLVIDLFTYDADIYALLKENGFEFVYHFPILTFASFKELVHRGVKYITIDRPLMFQIDKIKSFKMPIKFNPVHADDYMPNESAWVRPEDVALYEPCYLEFKPNNIISKNLTLLKIYKDASWDGRLSMIIDGITDSAYGALLPEDFGKTRSKCGQRCMNTPDRTCHYCDLTLKMGAYKDELKETIDKK